MKKSEAVEILLKVAIKGKNSVTRQELAAAIEATETKAKKSACPKDARRAQAKADAIAAEAKAAEEAKADQESVAGVFEPEVVTTVTGNE